MNRTKAEWVFLIEQQNQSDMTMADFCRANGININAFYNARSRYGFTRQTLLPRINEADLSASPAERNDFVHCALPESNTIILEPVRILSDTASVKTPPFQQPPAVPDDPLAFWINGIQLVIPSCTSQQNLTRIVSACLLS